MVWPLQSLPGYHFPNELINTDWDSTKETEKLDIFSSLAGSVFGVKHLLPKCTWLYWIYAAAAKLLQSCPTLCNPIDGSPPGFPVPGILQARTLEWLAISFSSAEKWKVKVKSLSRVRLLSILRTAAHQRPLSMGFSRQEYWSGVPLPSPLNLYSMPKIQWITMIPVKVRFVSRCKFLLLENKLLSKYWVDHCPHPHPTHTHILPTSNFLNF